MFFDFPLLALLPVLGQGFGNFTSSIFFPILLMFLVMYMLFLGPEKKKRAAVNQMQQDLKKNDKIITIGGIYGTVVNAAKDSNEVTIRVDENTRIKISRNAIAHRQTDDDDKKKND